MDKTHTMAHGGGTVTHKIGTAALIVLALSGCAMTPEETQALNGFLAGMVVGYAAMEPSPQWQPMPRTSVTCTSRRYGQNTNMVCW